MNGTGLASKAGMGYPSILSVCASVALLGCSPAVNDAAIESCVDGTCDQDVSLDERAEDVRAMVNAQFPAGEATSIFECADASGHAKAELTGTWTEFRTDRGHLLVPEVHIKGAFVGETTFEGFTRNVKDTAPPLQLGPDLSFDLTLTGSIGFFGYFNIGYKPQANVENEEDLPSSRPALDSYFFHAGTFGFPTEVLTGSGFEEIPARFRLLVHDASSGEESDAAGGAEVIHYGSSPIEGCSFQLSYSQRKALECATDSREWRGHPSPLNRCSQLIPLDADSLDVEAFVVEKTPYASIAAAGLSGIPEHLLSPEVEVSICEQGKESQALRLDYYDDFAGSSLGDVPELAVFEFSDLELAPDGEYCVRDFVLKADFGDVSLDASFISEANSDGSFQFRRGDCDCAPQ